MRKLACSWTKLRYLVLCPLDCLIVDSVDDLVLKQSITEETVPLSQKFHTQVSSSLNFLWYGSLVIVIKRKYGLVIKTPSPSVDWIQTTLILSLQLGISVKSGSEGTIVRNFRCFSKENWLLKFISSSFDRRNKTVVIEHSTSGTINYFTTEDLFAFVHCCLHIAVFGLHPAAAYFLRHFWLV